LAPRLIECRAARRSDTRASPARLRSCPPSPTTHGELLAHPRDQVESTAGGFSYRNVPVRIVALRGNAARLEAILAGLRPLPETRLTLVPGRAPEGAVGNASTR
jgi:hypothetical protein